MSRTKSATSFLWLLALVVAIGGGACGGRNERPPVTTSGAGPADLPGRTSATGPTRSEPPVAMPTPGEDDASLSAMGDPDNIYGRTLEEINADNPLEDLRFEFDSAVLLPEARSTLDRHADWLKRYPSVTLVIEGHCDERGTVEYNLALGERRATAAYNYLMSLGIASDRLKTISYGKEFPLDPGHDEAAWARNRRAHFEITGK